MPSDEPKLVTVSFGLNIKASSDALILSISKRKLPSFATFGVRLPSVHQSSLFQEASIATAIPSLTLVHVEVPELYEYKC